MTIQEATPRISYTGDGVQDIFSFAFPLIAEEDLTVTIDGVAQVLDTDYTIENLTSSGGDVDFVTPPVDQTAILFVRDTELDQDVVYTPFDPFPAKTHEGALDKLTMQMQDLGDEVDNFTTEFMSKDGSLAFWEAENLLISNLLDPVDPQDAATKAYIDAVATTGDTLAAADEVITGAWTFAGVTTFTDHLNLDNDVGLRGKDTGGSNRNMIKMLPNDRMQVGNSSSITQYQAQNLHDFINARVEIGMELQLFSPPIIDGLLWPPTVGTDGQALVTDGANALRWATLGSGGTGLDPTADETITGLWNFAQTIQGFCSGNLLLSDLDNYPQLSGGLEVIQNQWSFSLPINGSCDGNISTGDTGLFAQKAIAESITGNWDFTQNIQFNGGLTIEAAAGNASLSLDVTSGVQGHIFNNNTGFSIAPDSVNTHQIFFDQVTFDWSFSGGGGGGGASVVIYEDHTGPLGGISVRAAGNGIQAALLNTFDNPPNPVEGDWSVEGDWTFVELITGECSGNIGSSADFTVTGTWSFASEPILNNNVALKGGLVGDVSQVDLIQMGLGDVMVVGDSTVDMATTALAAMEINIAGTPVAQFETPANGSLNLIDRDGSFQEAGFRGARKWSINSDFSLTQVQEDMVVDFNGATAGQTITADTLKVWTTITVKNTSSNPVTLGEGTATLTHLDGSGVIGATGDLTLAVGGVATLYWDGNSDVHVWGVGIS